ncbi:hypothetical protein ACIHCQ_33215 [Streptomyces sp. NPDC052236]|uniref:hypothetical protein n=1 Tax=Streptomyces sp. NPDC052236 TaxID=3365686 RepID=UPI0037D462BB
MPDVASVSSGADKDALSCMFRLAGPSMTPALVTRLREETLRLLHGDTSLPGHLVDHVVDSGDRELLAALTVSYTGPQRRSGLLRMAALADPSLAGTLYGAEHPWRPELRAAVLAGAASSPYDPGWRAPGGLVSILLATTAADDLLPALRGPFPEVVRHVLRTQHRVLSARHQVDACRAVLAYGGVDELATLADLPGMRRSVAEVVRRAVVAPDPAAVLAMTELTEAVVAARADRPGDPAPRDREGSPAASASPPPVPPVPPSGGLTARLRRADSGADATSVLSGTVSPDWDLLVAEHHREPFPDRALEILWSRPGCPEELALAAYSRVPGAVPKASVVPWRLLLEEDWCREEHRLPGVLARGLAQGSFPVERVLAEVRPARQVINALPLEEDSVRSALAGLIAPLGGDFPFWRAVYTLLPRFGGSFAELLETVREEVSQHQGKTWPKPLSQEFPARHPQMARSAFLHLFQSATGDVQRALLPHLEERLVQQLLVFREPSPETLGHVIEARGTAALAGWASRWDLPAKEIGYLLGFDDPGINTKLFCHTNLTDEQRRQVLAGRRCQGGGERLPVTDELVEALRVSGRRPWLLAIRESGDPRLARVLLGKIKLHTPAGQLLLVTRLWERAGPEEVRALLAETTFPERRGTKHPLPPATHKIVERCLQATDGLADLRARLAESRTPVSQVAFLRGLSGGPTPEKVIDALTRLSEEISPELPWDELSADHARDPLPDVLLLELAKRDDFPPALSAGVPLARLRYDHWAHRPRRSDPRPGALDLLRLYPLSPSSRVSQDWLSGAVRSGLLSPPDVLREARPAQSAMACLDSLPATSQEQGGSPGEVEELAVKYLGENLEAWAVAVRLLPEFTGTIPELLETAAAVVG